MSMMGEL
jgi:hypothetical protein